MAQTKQININIVKDNLLRKRLRTQHTGLQVQGGDLYNS